MALTIFNTQLRELSLLQTSWSSVINTVLSNPLINGSILVNIGLQTGANVVNHLLGRNMQGYILIDQNSAASIYRSAPLNNLTLTLTASSPVIVSLYVF